MNDQPHILSEALDSLDERLATIRWSDEFHHSLLEDIQECASRVSFIRGWCGIQPKGAPKSPEDGLEQRRRVL